MPVSYTHLDVYKRQEQAPDGCCDLLQVITAFFASNGEIKVESMTITCGQPKQDMEYFKQATHYKVLQRAELTLTVLF